MRMPFLEFITGGDLKFILAYVVVLGLFVFRLLKQSSADADLQRARRTVLWFLPLSGFTLLLGLMHSFYFLGQTGGAAPGLIYAGVARALITPVLGMALYILCQLILALVSTKKQSA